MAIETEDREYDGYHLSGIHHPPFWQVHIYPGERRGPLPQGLVRDRDKETAFEKAIELIRQHAPRRAGR